MREIKFRCWFKKTEFEEGHFEYFTIKDISDGYVNGTYVLDGRPIEPYTGLKDKNGKEIYEGDFIGDKYGNKGCVRWISREEKYDYSGWYVDGDEGVDLPWGEENDVVYNVSIVGNIHETPGILK